MPNPIPNLSREIEAILRIDEAIAMLSAGMYQSSYETRIIEKLYAARVALTGTKGDD